jgi:hypothetical protein
MPEAVPGPQVFGEARPLLDAVHLLRDVWWGKISKLMNN